MNTRSICLIFFIWKQVSLRNYVKFFQDFIYFINNVKDFCILSHCLSPLSPIVTCITVRQGHVTSACTSAYGFIHRTCVQHAFGWFYYYICMLCTVVFNISKISSNNIYKNKKLYNVVVLISQLPRVLQPVEGLGG